MGGLGRLESLMRVAAADCRAHPALNSVTAAREDSCAIGFFFYDSLRACREVFSESVTCSAASHVRKK